MQPQTRGSGSQALQDSSVALRAEASGVSYKYVQTAFAISTRDKRVVRTPQSAAEADTVSSRRIRRSDPSSVAT